MLKEPSVVSLSESEITTLLVGAVSSTTLNWTLLPASLVTKPEVGETAMPGGDPVTETWYENSDVPPYDPAPKSSVAVVDNR